MTAHALATRHIARFTDGFCIKIARQRMSRKALPVLRRLDQMICGFHRHDTVLRSEPGRLLLRCLRCGYETQGWAIGHRPPAGKQW
jgi:hypothetical protein